MRRKTFLDMITQEQWFQRTLSFNWKRFLQRKTNTTLFRFLFCVLISKFSNTRAAFDASPNLCTCAAAIDSVGWRGSQRCSCKIISQMCFLNTFLVSHILVCWLTGSNKNKLPFANCQKHYNSPLIWECLHIQWPDDRPWPTFGICGEDFMAKSKIDSVRFGSVAVNFEYTHSLGSCMALAGLFRNFIRRENKIWQFLGNRFVYW